MTTFKGWLKKVSEGSGNYYDPFILYHKDIGIVCKQKYGVIAVFIYSKYILREFGWEAVDAIAWDYYIQPSGSNKDLIEFANKVLVEGIHEEYLELVDTLDDFINRGSIVCYHNLDKKTSELYKGKIKQIADTEDKIKHNLKCLQLIIEDK